VVTSVEGGARTTKDVMNFLGAVRDGVAKWSTREISQWGKYSDSMLDKINQAPTINGNAY